MTTAEAYSKNARACLYIAEFQKAQPGTDYRFMLESYSEWIDYCERQEAHWNWVQEHYDVFYGD